MLIQAIVRAIIFYGIFLLLRGMWRSFKMVKAIKTQMKDANAAFEQQNSTKYNQASGDVFDAEYRVVKEE